MIAGIDYDTRYVHIVLIPDEGWQPEYHRVHLASTGDYGVSSARSIRLTFPGRTWWEERRVWLAGLELTYSHDARTAGALGRIQGAILATLPADIPVIPTPPNEWLRVFTGRAKLPARKAERKQLAREQTEALAGENTVSGWHQDGYDAYGIACAVRAMNEDGIAAAKPAA